MFVQENAMETEGNSCPFSARRVSSVFGANLIVDESTIGVLTFCLKCGYVKPTYEVGMVLP